MIKKRIKAYWPIAVMVPLAVVAYLHLISVSDNAVHPGPLAVDRVGDELARTVSYGFFADEDSIEGSAPSAATAPIAETLAHPASGVHHAPAPATTAM